MVDGLMVQVFPAPFEYSDLVRGADAVGGSRW